MFTPFFALFALSYLEAEPKIALPSFSSIVFRCCSMCFSLDLGQWAPLLVGLQPASDSQLNEVQVLFMEVISSRIVKMISIFEGQWFG